jgi:hypothetical protein
MDDKEQLANAITKGLAYQENGGKLNLNKTSAGQSGEMKSIFQFTPATWKGYSKEVFGHEMPLNNDNETYVVKHKVKKWIDEGKTTSQIASMWNAGEGHPDAYKEDWRGTNSHGVNYDTPTYAKNVVKYAKKFYEESNQKSPIDNVAPATQQTNQDVSNNGLLGKAISQSKLTI